MTLYITSLSLIFLIIFYAPLVLWLLTKILRTNFSFRNRVIFSIFMLILAYAIPLGEVTMNSIAMAKVCPQAGLHIYRTVEVDGYIDSTSDQFLRENDYSFIETPQPGTDGKSYSWVRYEKQKDGSILHTRVNQPSSSYEVLTPGGYADYSGVTLSETQDGVRKTRWVIRDRETGEIIAEWLFFNAVPAGPDKFMMYGTGGETLSCTFNSDFSSWPKHILLPKK